MGLNALDPAGLSSSALNGVSNLVPGAASLLKGPQTGKIAKNGLPLVGNRAKNPNYCVYITSQREPKNGSPRTIAVMANLPETFDMSVSSEYAPAFMPSGLQDAMGIVGKGMSAFGYSVVNQLFTQQLWQGTTPLTFTIPLELVAFSNADSEISAVIQDLFELVAPSKGVGVLKSPGPSLKDGAAALAAMEKVGADSAKFVSDSAAATSQGVTNVVAGYKNGVPMATQATTVVNTGKAIEDKAVKLLAQIEQTLSSNTDDLWKNKVSLQIGAFLRFDNVIVTGVSPTWDVMPDFNGQFMRAKIQVSFTTAMVMTIEDLRACFLFDQEQTGT